MKPEDCPDGRPGRCDRLALRLPTTRAEVHGGDVPAFALAAVVDARADDPARHSGDRVVDGGPGSLATVIVY